MISSHRNSSGDTDDQKQSTRQRDAQGRSGHGALDMMILGTLFGGDAHRQTVAEVIERTSEDLLEVEPGSLYPALHRPEGRRWESSDWGVCENNRKENFYRLTTEGRKQLGHERSRWRQRTQTIGPVIGEEEGAQ
jgi:PadR family transcriptional regulator PadR